jgi:hypothetical protein
MPESCTAQANASVRGSIVTFLLPQHQGRFFPAAPVGI